MDLGRWKGMTNEETIKTLEANYPDACFEQLREAVDAAIEALKAQDADSDTISRKATIDAILAVTGNSSVRELYEHVQEHGLSDMWSGGVNAAIDIIIAVPSAHPEPCEDTISRKAAIDAMEGVDWYHINSNGQLVHGANSKEDEPLYKADDVYKVLNDVPSAQQRWIPCSERLPEERQEILATTTDNAWGDVVIIRTYYKEMHKSVIAWMPLPEPYAERRTDEQDSE